MRQSLDVEDELNSRNYTLVFRQAFQAEGLSPYNWFKRQLGGERPLLSRGVCYGDLSPAHQTLLDEVRTRYKALWRASGKKLPKVLWSTKADHPLAAECRVYLIYAEIRSARTRSLLWNWSR